VIPVSGRQWYRIPAALRWEPALQLTGGTGRRRLSDAEPFGRAGDVQVLSDRTEVAQFAGFRLRPTARAWGGTHPVFFLARRAHGNGTNPITGLFRCAWI
jgi:predicted pyridoxine 5'-phosphate oxidase superfamily flavin-nucleotide-binding protein